MKRALVLFTRDLRVHDQPSLMAATREVDEIVPAFVLDRQLLASNCGAPNRLAFLLESLQDLQSSLASRGGALIVRHGEIVREVLALAHEWDVSAIYMSADATPYARAREQRLLRACEPARIALHTFEGVNVIAPGELTPTGGDHYRVFTPYWRAWRAASVRTPLRAPRRITTPTGLSSTPIPELWSLATNACSPHLQPGGETAARAQLRRWLRTRAERYDVLHDDLAGDGTSRLSAYVHFGCLSAATVLQRSDGHHAAEDLARQLCWRDFHSQVLAARADMTHADYRPRGDRWRRDARALHAWREGRTGYPIVDAGMRQLTSEGFMHNRARLIVASFLTKTLYLDWRSGAEHFASLLIDADVANNVGNWQWVAGTGNDTRPNRVLNPLRQAQRFDPQGEYVRRYVPELQSLEGSSVHEPWLLPQTQRRRLRYPAPLVDHQMAAAEMRARRYSSSSPA
ncbi:MAG: deoxyribodipyrimidine photo-lyase [Solirubrobacteraceae bacterium]